MRLPEWNQPLREWQEKAADDYIIANKHDFLVSGTPGCGKTRFAKKVAYDLLTAGVVKRIVVVCPTAYLRGQWANAFEKEGVEIKIDSKFTGKHNVAESRDFVGVVVTYASLEADKELHRRLCQQTPTLVIFDEIHHAAEQRTWGAAMRRAFELAKKRLGISGTLFRHDNNPIPFVSYDNEQRSVADFVYTYYDALDGCVCRPVSFPSYEGTMSWRTDAGQFEASFKDDIGETEASRRLRTALDAYGDWLPKILADANAKLSECRQTLHNAGGLVVCIDQNHARAVAKILKRLTGETPTLAISEEDDPTNDINAFVQSNARWIVTCKMVSEGVDIPRLRVGVFATITRTELFFRQFVGRFVRGEDGEAFIYIPHDAAILGYAKAIQQERDHQLREELSRSREEDDAEEGKSPRKLGVFQPLQATAIPDAIIHAGEAFTPAELDEARLRIGRLRDPASLSVFDMAMLLRDLQGSAVAGACTPATPQPVEREPTSVRKKKLRSLIGRLVSRYCAITGREHKDVNRELGRTQGFYITDQTLESDLERRRDYVSELIVQASGERVCG